MIKGQLFIDGKWVPPASNASIRVIDPATESVFAQIAGGDRADMAAAVSAARNAFDSGAWPGTPARDRAQILRAIAAEIRDRLEELSMLEVRDNGKPLPEARWDIGDAAGCFEFYADLAEADAAKLPESVKLPDDRFSSRVMREPVGVVGAITPWNYPLLMAAWKVAPALAAGCTVVLKPSEFTSLTALELAAIGSNAGLPAGALNVVTGLGAQAGATLTEHSGVDKIAFTGSVQTGSRVMQAAAMDIKRVSLELGGKSPFIVFADSDVEKAVEWIMFGIFWNQGQVCSATSRVLVERTLYRQVVERLVEEAKRIKIGGGLDSGVLLGPLVSQPQYDKVRNAIDRGVADGARLATGGSQRPSGLDRGYFVSPTVFSDVAADSWIWREEIFGPVVCVAPFDSEDEAVREANNSRYGLAAAIMSDDLQRCDRVAERLRAGIVWINCSQPTFTEAPWGGFKKSGIGRELGRWGYENYLETKQVTRYDSSQKWGWYIK